MNQYKLHINRLRYQIYGLKQADLNQKRDRQELLRQYFPKGMELTNITEEQVQEAVVRNNHRPRKAFEFRTPHEVFFRVEYATPSNHWLLHFELESAHRLC